MVRKGAKKAVMALAHHLITIVYNILARSEEYVELGGDYYDQRNKPKVVSRLVARLIKLGYYVDLKPVEPYEPPPVAAEPPTESGEPPAESVDRAAESTSERPVLMVTSVDSPNVNAQERRGRPCKCDD